MKSTLSILLIFTCTLVSVAGLGQSKVHAQKQTTTETKANRTEPVVKFDIQLEGKQVPDSAVVYVRYITGKELTLAPVHFNKGKASFQAEITKPTLMMLFLARDGASFNARPRKVPMEKLSFYADPREAGARISFNGSISTAKVSSGKLQQAFEQYSVYLKSYDDQLHELLKQRSALYQAENKDSARLAKVAGAIARQRGIIDSAKRTFASKYPTSYFALLGLTEAAGYHIDAAAIRPIFTSLSPKLKQSPLGKEFAAKIALAEKLKIGQQAPDFLQYDPSGQPVRLSDFKGNYVLLDFWASWCGPCRAQNPQVVKLYDAFKDKNFELIGISLDNQAQKIQWLEAIEHDHLSWIQVSDLKGWKNEAASAYGIQAVPQNYLIGPKGKILAADLEINALKAYLNKVL